MARKKAGRSRNGTGSVSLRKDGRWQGAIASEGVRKYVYGKSRDEVQAKLLEVDLSKSDDARTLRYYVGEHSTSLSQSSRSTYLHTLDLYAKAFADKPVDDIAPRDISLHLRKLASKGLGKSVIANTSSLFKTALDIAMEDGVIKSNPARELRRKLPGSKDTVAVEAWDASQIAKFEDYLAKISSEDKRWIEAAYLIRVRHGLRPAELLGLRLEDFHDGDHPYLTVRGQYQRSQVDIKYRPVEYVLDGDKYRRRVLPEQTARIGKVRVTTGKTASAMRDVFIDGRTARAIRTWLEVREREIEERQVNVKQQTHIENQQRKIAAAIKQRAIPADSTHFTEATALWTARAEDACVPVAFETDTREWRRAVKDAGLPHVSRYSGRHTAATRAIEDGVPLGVLSRSMGHSDIKVTHSVYVARDSQRDERRAAGSRFTD